MLPVYGKKIYGFDKPVVIAAGWKPGWSTDYCATLLARDHDASTIINLSNIEAVYDKDPNLHKDAKPLKQITWENFEKLVGTKWTPGANLPFDPVATKLSKSLGLTVFIVKGVDLDNVKKALQGQPFKGTIVLPARHDSSFYNREYFELGIGYSGYTTTKKGRLLSHLANLYRALTIKIFLKPKTVLDVGCATGLLVYYLRKMGIEAYGIEVSKYALSKAHPGIKNYLQYGNIYRLPFNDKSFDVVTTFEVLEHLEINEMKEALSECCRVKKRLVIHKIFTLENKWITKTRGDDFSRINIHNASWWKDFLNSLGYEEVKVLFFKLPKFMETVFLLDKKTK
ncbi:methyltransferase domain-containing protein [Candidatus Gottesmanbacteria bacterium]|nr:methyltransferase domain-containing protein [Candidatus Gottesmanbacteria bacterium]